MSIRMHFAVRPRRSMRPVAAAALVMLACGAQPAFAQASMAVSAILVSKSNCRFDGTSLALDFGLINPASTADATAVTGGTVSCNGGQSNTVTLGFSIGTGSNPTGTGTRRMRHATLLTEFLAYGVSISPASATIPRNSTMPFTINGIITPAQFQNVTAGSYLDAVTITVAP